MMKQIFVAQTITPIDGTELTLPITYKPKQVLALLIPGHNEELVIQHTIKSAIQSGMPAKHIYVVNDASTDNTVKLAEELIGKKNVLTVKRSGKAGAILKAIKAFKIERTYQWLHIADADSTFENNYFDDFRKNLDSDKYVAAAGYVKSLDGGWISRYRAYEYAFGQEIMRRVQHMLGVIPVIPGPTSCFRTDILKHLDFTTGNITEDFDITLQIHRNRLGKIAYISTARALTQDPKNYRDYVKQITRWYRGFWRGIIDRKVGLRAQRIDFYLGYQILEMFLYYFNVLVLLPLLLIRGGAAQAIALTFLIDAGLFFASTVMGAVVHKRFKVLTAFPLFYILRVTNMFVYLKAFVEVVILRRHRGHSKGWSVSGRRYKIAEAA
ncbi:glycosyltransferase family 2 protein [bacterium]|nr:glycosyltransferase family 2 protein [bacterium]